MPATNPADCAEAKCDLVLKKCNFVAKDADGDGHTAKDCTAIGSGAVATGDDCDDSSSSIYPGSGTEKCNGKDDDCDGQTDEDAPNLTDPCTVGVGECQATGVKTCKDGSYSGCSATPGTPSPDYPVCDGKDHDCDGATNTGCVCPTGKSEPCGNCGGNRTCVAGQWGPCSVVTPPNLGASCNNSCGTIKCDGSCSNSTPNVGGSCNNSCGTIKCDGSCSNSTSNVGGGCNNNCGTINCDGSCSKPSPANWGQSCGACGKGKIDCAGSCVGDSGPTQQVGDDPGGQGPYSDYGVGGCHNCSGVGPNQEFVTHWYSGAIPTVGSWSVTGSVTVTNTGGGCWINSNAAIKVECYDSLPGCAGPYVFLGTTTVNNNQMGQAVPLVGTVTTPGHTICCNYKKPPTGDWTPCFQACCNRNVKTTWTANGCF
ncbi:MAG: hypothetical protein HYZ29_29250 [Myxococcales bacterium]|nr:hypothetical protein [Myxococcales bacterium]